MNIIILRVMWLKLKGCHFFSKKPWGGVKVIALAAELSSPPAA
jgi:hypothetical protein